MAQARERHYATCWLGAGFEFLRSIIGDLHRDGGTLVGTVRIETGVVSPAGPRGALPVLRSGEG